MVEPKQTEAALREIERLLSRAEEITLASRSHSPFNEYLTQLSPEQYIAVERGISELRTSMICILRHLGVVTKDPHINTVEAVRGILSEAAKRLRTFDLQLDVREDQTLKDTGEATKLLRQMATVFGQMEHSLTIPDVTIQKKVSPL